MDRSASPPCATSRNRAFIDPESSTPDDIDQAIRMCGTCPLVQQCAADGLHSGTSLDRNVILPATGVIQAGVVCRGDRDTALQLSAVAGVDVPSDYRHQPERPKPMSECRECGTPMVKWTRGEVPEGYVMHHARNFCTGCRVAYHAYIEGRQRRFTRPVDRNRRHEINYRPQSRGQMSLF